VLAVGGRVRDGVVYPAREVALRHGAGVREQATEAAKAYADAPGDVDAEFDPRWLPGVA
jgi:hypothetical protein